jgi:hypothetical protein
MSIDNFYVRLRNTTKRLGNSKAETIIKKQKINCSSK